jgi:hypothetical protein
MTFMAGNSIKGAVEKALVKWREEDRPAIGTYQYRLKGTYQLAAFHGKKMIGVHLGRNYPGMLAPLEAAGWPYLFLPNARRGGTCQRRDLVEEEWQFFTQMFELNDFCGILLYTDLLPPATVAGFHQRFGPPVASANFTPGPGRLELIPKPRQLAHRVDPARGITVRLRRPVQPIELGKRYAGSERELDDYLWQGWTEPKQELRWSVAERASIAFRLEQPEPLALRMLVKAAGRQQIRISCNGTLLETRRVRGRSLQLIEIAIPEQVLAERNTIQLELPDARSRGDQQLGLGVKWLELAAPASTR